MRVRLNLCNFKFILDDAITTLQTGVDIAASSKRAHVQGLAVPAHPDVERELLEKWQSSIASMDKDGITKLLILSLERQGAEDLILAIAAEQPRSSSSMNHLEALPTTAPRYALVEYATTTQAYVVFVYICPAASAVRERMVYAASRASVTDFIEKECGVNVAKKVLLVVGEDGEAAMTDPCACLRSHNQVELDDPAELTEEFLRQTLDLNSPAMNATAGHGFIKKKVSGPGMGEFGEFAIRRFISPHF